MHEITINGITLQYETEYDHIEIGEEARTHFYMGTSVITRKKWMFYGPTYEEVVPRKVFTIFADSNDVRLSKEWWRKMISKELEVLDRAAELKKGELI